jgi:glycosyltransferase involved in cell wall biosynthesis
MIKILHVCHEPLPSHHTNAEQTVMTAAALSAAGAQVDLVCPRPVGRAASGWDRVSEFYGTGGATGDPIRLIELTAPWACRGRAVKTWLDIRAARFGRHDGYDFHLVRDPVALTAALNAGRRTIFDSYRYDLHTDIRHWPWRAIYYRHEKLAGFITHSEMARASLLDAGVERNRTLVAHNGHDPRTAGPQMSKSDARQRLGLPRDRDIVVYTGRVGRDKGTDCLPLLALELPRVQFLIVGHIPGSRPAKRLAQRISALGLENVTLIPRVPPSALSPYLCAADCLLIPPSAAPLHKHRRTVLPMKVFRYMGAGRPILGPSNPDVSEVLRDGHNALLVQPDDVGSAVRGLRRILDDETLRDRLARNALADAQDHSWSRRAQKIIAFMHSRM